MGHYYGWSLGIIQYVAVCSLFYGLHASGFVWLGGSSSSSISYVAHSIYNRSMARNRDDFCVKRWLVQDIVPILQKNKIRREKEENRLLH